MRHALAPLAVTLLVTAPAHAQDVEFIRALDRAQSARPVSLASTARIAPEREPGIPLVIRGRVVHEDGTTPLAGAVVFAYHTDQGGLYDDPRNGAHSWRLRGWAETDGAGRFEFRTIRPGAYPSSRVPAHVHFTVFAGAHRYYAGELQFEDDELLSLRERQISAARGAFAPVRPVRVEGGTQHVEIALRVEARQRF